AEEVIGAEEPLPVPALLEHDLLHLGDLGADALRLALVALALDHVRVHRTNRDEHACDEDRLGSASFAVLRRLEALARRLAEAVQIQTIVPVGAPNEREAVRTDVVQDVVEGALTVLEEALGLRFVVVEGDLLVEDREVARLLDV